MNSGTKLNYFFERQSIAYNFANLYFQEMDNGEETEVIPKMISIKPKLIIRSLTQKTANTFLYNKQNIKYIF
jgi:hypothetical protein